MSYGACTSQYTLYFIAIETLPPNMYILPLPDLRRMTLLRGLFRIIYKTVQISPLLLNIIYCTSCPCYERLLLERLNVVLRITFGQVLLICKLYCKGGLDKHILCNLYVPSFF